MRPLIHSPRQRSGRFVVPALLCILMWPAGVAHADESPELPPTRQLMEVVGFTRDGKSVALRIDDENAGLLFQVRRIKDGESEAVYPFTKETEAKVFKSVVRKQKLDPDWVAAQENVKKKITLMTEVREDKICVFVMRGEAIKKYSDFPLYKSPNGKFAEAFVKAAVWGPQGKHVVLIYNQKTREKLSWDGDFVEAFKYKGYRVDFGDGGEPESDD